VRHVAPEEVEVVITAPDGRSAIVTGPSAASPVGEPWQAGVKGSYVVDTEAFAGSATKGSWVVSVRNAVGPPGGEISTAWLEIR